MIWTWIKGAVASVAALLRAVLDYIGYWFAYRLGKKTARMEAEREVNKARKKQLDIAAEPNQHRSDILDKLRKGKL